MNYDNSNQKSGKLSAKANELLKFAFENDQSEQAKEILSKLTGNSNLNATPQFAIDSMAQKIQEDWDNFTKEAQQKMDNAYDRIAREGKEHQDEGFIQQSIEYIKQIKQEVQQARQIKNIRKEDLRMVQELLGGKLN